MCAFCQVKESTSLGKWLVCGDYVGRRDPPSALRDTCADNGFASSVGQWVPRASVPFRCNICRAWGAAKRRETLADERKSRRDPASVCRDIFSVCPWVAELRRASPAELRTALLCVKKHHPPPNASGLEDVLGRGDEVPSDSTSLLLMTAQFPGAGAQAGKVALESVDRFCLSRAPHMKYKYLLAGGARFVDKLRNTSDVLQTSSMARSSGPSPVSVNSSAKQCASCSPRMRRPVKVWLPRPFV